MYSLFGLPNRDDLSFAYFILLEDPFITIYIFISLN